jgi:hypothetical protein
MEETAEKYGIEGLSIKKNSLGNMEIFGFGDSQEELLAFMLLLSEVMSKYQDHLTDEEVDISKSSAISGMNTYFGNTNEYTN